MGVEELLAKGKREMKPLLVKAGLVLSLSLASYFYLHRRSCRRHPRLSSTAASGGEGEGIRKAGGGLKDELLLLQCEEEASPKVGNGPTTAMAATTLSGKNSGDKEACLLPESNELVVLGGGLETQGKSQDAPAAKSFSENREEAATEQEVMKMRNLVRSLRERERSLEIQLLEYYGLKEQETAARELENRLRMNTMEAKLLAIKIETLQADNRRLEAQVSDHSRIKAELESAKAKVKHLKRKLMRLDSEQAKEKVAALHQRFAAVQDGEECGRDDEEVERSLKRLKDLEDEAVELRRANSILTEENSDLARKLESTQILASSVLETREATEALEEANRLRQTNDDLTREIEQLQADRCADVEELVYLRWVNACLRYELRNYQPPPGKAAAKDLSTTLSPKSEEKAKQLILEYANSGINEKNVNLSDLYSEQCSFSSRSSSLTETGELDVTSADVVFSTPTKGTSPRKSKFFSKLKRLVLGKDTRHTRVVVASVDRSSPTSCGGNSERRLTSISACSLEEMMGTDSSDAPNNEVPWTRNLSRVSLDFRRLKSLSSEEEEAGEAKKGECSRSDVGTS